MGEKLYRPILQEGDHLVKSNKNKGRVRGISQDKNNKTTDIVEWEEVEVEGQTYGYESQQVELTSEQQRNAEMIGVVIAAGVIYGAVKLNERVIRPWWCNCAKPWIDSVLSDASRMFFGETKDAEVLERREDKSNRTSNFITNKNNSQIDSMMDQVLNSLQFNMSTEEAKKHMMNLIYHMLGIAYEIKMLSNSRIADQIADENIRIENQAKAENFLVEKVADNINRLLSDKTLQLDESTSQRIFNLLDGGIRINEEYIPVKKEKIKELIHLVSNLVSNLE